MMIKIERLSSHNIIIRDAEGAEKGGFSGPIKFLDDFMQMQEEARKYRREGHEHYRETQKKRLQDLRNVTTIQCQPGNYDFDEYMRGMANGLILAQAIMEGTEPMYIVAPAKPAVDEPDRTFKPSLAHLTEQELLDKWVTHTISPGDYVAELTRRGRYEVKAPRVPEPPKLPDIVVTQNGKVMDDQVEALRLFKMACGVPGVEPVKIWYDEAADTVAFEKLTPEAFQRYTPKPPEPAVEQAASGDLDIPGAEATRDNIAVVDLSQAMRKKLDKKRKEGFGGWNNPALCSQEELSRMLMKHVIKGDPVDVANLCAFLHYRREKIELNTPHYLLLEVFFAASSLAMTKAQTPERQEAIDEIRRLVCGL